MKQSLQLNVSQSLTLTPQLQQAIKLLQLSTIDLQQEIQSAVESNPMLEMAQEDNDETSSLTQSQTNDDFIDFQWNMHSHSKQRDGRFEDDDYNFDNLHCTTTNLNSHMHWQLGLSPMSDIDRAIATTLIDALNDDGFLSVGIEELHASCNSKEIPIDIEEVIAVKHKLQLFDPVGCFVESLAETLLVQLSQLSLDESTLKLIKNIIHNDLELLAQHNYKQLMKNHQVNEQAIDNVLHIIQSLNPKPGSIIQEATPEYIIPDITVKKINGQWKAGLNNNALPKLSINNQYAALIQKQDNSQDNQFLKSNLQEARWFLKSIQSRQETLYKVASCIVAYQKEFLEYGEEAMKPLVLNDVARALDMHESTISRVTTQKFMHTPRGVFELKYFFSSHINSDSGGECSSTAIRAVIKKLITTENRKKPLSDSKIVAVIAQQGIKIARRTVAKYRESMGIAPSHERKSIGK